MYLLTRLNSSEPEIATRAYLYKFKKAIENNDIQSINILLKKKFDYNQKHDSLFAKIAEKNDFQLLKRFYRNFPNIYNEAKIQALEMAANNQNSKEVIDFLLDLKTCPLDKDGKILINSFNKIENFSYLLNKIKINFFSLKKNKILKNILFKAIYEQKIEAVNELLVFLRKNKILNDKELMNIIKDVLKAKIKWEKSLYLNLLNNFKDCQYVKVLLDIAYKDLTKNDFLKLIIELKNNPCYFKIITNIDYNYQELKKIQFNNDLENKLIIKKEVKKHINKL